MYWIWSPYQIASHVLSLQDSHAQWSERGPAPTGARVSYNDSQKPHVTSDSQRAGHCRRGSKLRQCMLVDQTRTTSPSHDWKSYYKRVLTSVSLV